MGGFLLIKREPDISLEETDKLFGAPLNVFKKKGLPLNKKIVTPEYLIYVFHKQKLTAENAVLINDTDFIISTGTLIYKGKIAGPALRELYANFSENCQFLSDVMGQYSLIVFKNGKLYLLNDVLGVYPVYADSSKNVFSSSFLAVWETLNKKTVSPQELYEFLTHETFYGGRTIIKEIELLDRKSIWQLSPSPRELNKIVKLPGLQRSNSFSGMIQEFTGILVPYFGTLKRVFGDSICSALSGGYDSRLMLALMRKNGIHPYLYVYGRENSTDVKLAKLMAEGERFPIAHENRSIFPVCNEEKYLDQLERDFYLFDGLGEGGGTFDTGFEMNSRFKRADHAKLQLHGAGGETFRNRLRLRDKPYDLMPLLKSQLDNIDTAIFTPRFNKGHFFSQLYDKSKVVFDNRTQKIDRQSVEKFYPLFLLNYWLSHNAKINNQFIYTIYPFADASITYPGLDIPLKFKNFSVFVAALLNHIDPALARYPSQYGFKYSDYNNQPLKMRLKYSAKLYAPIPLRIFVRKYLWNRNKLGKKRFPYYFGKTYLDKIFPSPDLNIAEYVNVDKIIDHTMLSRALSVELLLSGRF